MKKNLLISFSFLFTSFAFAQFGIGTATPKTTLDVVGEPTNATVKDGLTAPRLTCKQLLDKHNSGAYGADQTGALVYITDVSDVNCGNTITTEIKTAGKGYYAFDGAQFKKMALNSDLGGTSFYTSNGTLSSNRTVTQGANSLTLDGTGNFIKTGGNVGIGTTTPNYKLEVAGNAMLNTTEVMGDRLEVGIRGNGDRFSYLDFHAFGVPAASDYSARLIRYPAVNGPMHLVNTGTGSLQLGTNNNTSQFSIISNGNIGIGTTIPNGSLQFVNLIGNRKIVLWEDVNNDNQYYGFGINGSALRYQTSSTFADHVFYAGVNSTSSNELMRIKGNGNVGIGTSTPTTKLDVVGTARVSSLAGTGTRMVLANETGVLSAQIISSTISVLDTNGSKGTPGQVLKTDGVAKVYWSDAPSTNTLGDAKHGMQTADHGGWVLLNGRSCTDASMTSTQQLACSGLGLPGNALPQTTGFGQNTATYFADIDGKAATFGSIGGKTNNIWGASDLPNHNHNVDPVPFVTTDNAGAHGHSMRTWRTSSPGDGYGAQLDGAGGYGVGADYWPVDPAGAHNHTINVPDTKTNDGNGLGGGLVRTAPRTLDLNAFLFLGL